MAAVELVLLQRVGDIHHPQEIAALRSDAWKQIAIQCDLRTRKCLPRGRQCIVQARLTRPSCFVARQQFAIGVLPTSERQCGQFAVAPL